MTINVRFSLDERTNEAGGQSRRDLCNKRRGSPWINVAGARSSSWRRKWEPIGPPPFHPRSVETLINIAVNFGIRGRIIVPEVTFRISYDHRLEKPHVHVSKCGQTPVANEPFIALPNPLFDFFRFFFEGSISIDTFPPSLSTLISVDVYPSEKGHSISARKQIRPSRGRRERRVLRSCFFEPLPWLWGYFPPSQVSIDFRRESVDRGARE